MYFLRRRPLHTLAAGFTAVLLLAIAGGCSKDDPSTDFGSNDPSIVAALGDSITFGVYDRGIESCSDPTLGFCPRLQALSGKTVVNEGRCGEDSDGGVSRINGVLTRWRPGVILIDYSPNDIFNGSDHVIRNLQSMIATARANQTVPVIGTLVPAAGSHAGWEYFIEDLNAKIRILCKEEGLQCADHYVAFVNYPGFIENPFLLLHSDGEHPNSAGYTVMAQTWDKALSKVY